MSQPLRPTDEQVAAAQLRIELDKKLGRQTPEIVRQIAADRHPGELHRILSQPDLVDDTGTWRDDSPPPVDRPLLWVEPVRSGSEARPSRRRVQSWSAESRAGQAQALNNIGMVLQESGRSEEALGAFYQALDIYRSIETEPSDTEVES